MCNFKVGQKVVCVDSNFPFIPEYGGFDSAIKKPIKNEVLKIDEILGDFLRFNKYDTIDSFNWWHSSRFRPLDHQFAEDVIEYITELELATPQI